MEFIKLHNKGHLGGNPFTACRRFVAGMRFLSDFERSVFREHYKCCLNRDVRTNRPSADNLNEITATDRYLRAARVLGTGIDYQAVKTIILDDLPPTAFKRAARLSSYTQVYRLLWRALDKLDEHYEEQDYEENSPQGFNKHTKNRRAD